MDSIPKIYGLNILKIIRDKFDYLTRELLVVLDHTFCGILLKKLIVSASGYKSEGRCTI